MSLGAVVVGCEDEGLACLGAIERSLGCQSAAKNRENACLRFFYDAEARALHGPQVGLGVYAVRRAWVLNQGVRRHRVGGVGEGGWQRHTKA